MTFCSEKLGHPCSSPARRIEGACLNYSYYTKASAILSASPDVSGLAIRFEEDDGLVWERDRKRRARIGRVDIKIPYSGTDKDFTIPRNQNQHYISTLLWTLDPLNTEDETDK